MQRLKLEYDEPLSNLAFNLSWRRYITVRDARRRLLAAITVDYEIAVTDVAAAADMQALIKAVAPADLVVELKAAGRGLHSSTFQLNLSRFVSLTPPTDTEHPTKRAYFKPKKKVDQCKPLAAGLSEVSSAVITVSETITMVESPPPPLTAPFPPPPLPTPTAGNGPGGGDVVAVSGDNTYMFIGAGGILGFILILGRAVQDDPTRPKLKPPGTHCLELKCNIELYCFQLLFSNSTCAATPRSRPRLQAREAGPRLSTGDRGGHSRGGDRTMMPATSSNALQPVHSDAWHGITRRGED